VISRAQLRPLGLSDGGISARVARGALHRTHHGVYPVGHTRLVPRGRWMAAVPACGTDAGSATAGYRTLRFTHRQITHDPATVTRALQAALSQPAAAWRGASP
jgi:hypothetical protein